MPFGQTPGRTERYGVWFGNKLSNRTTYEVDIWWTDDRLQSDLGKCRARSRKKRVRSSSQRSEGLSQSDEFRQATCGTATVRRRKFGHGHGGHTLSLRRRNDFLIIYILTAIQASTRNVSYIKCSDVSSQKLRYKWRKSNGQLASNLQQPPNFRKMTHMKCFQLIQFNGNDGTNASRNANIKVTDNSKTHYLLIQVHIMKLHISCSITTTSQKRLRHDRRGTRYRFYNRNRWIQYIIIINQSARRKLLHYNRRHFTSCLFWASSLTSAHKRLIWSCRRRIVWLSLWPLDIRLSAMAFTCLTRSSLIVRSRRNSSNFCCRI